MSNSLMRRILSALVFAIVNFIIFSIMYKLFFYREDWISFSIMWSISWAVGRFASQSIDTLEKSIWSEIIKYILIIVIVSFLDAFILSILFKITQWKDILLSTAIPCGLGFIITKIIEKLD